MWPKFEISWYCLGSSVRNCLGTHLLWVGSFRLNDLDLSPFSRFATRGLFSDKEFELDRFAELGCTDSLVRRAASINLQNEEKDKFSKKIRHSSFIPWEQTLTSIISSSGSQQLRALLQNLFVYVSSLLLGADVCGLGELGFSKEELRIEQRQEVLKITCRSWLQVDIPSVGSTDQRLGNSLTQRVCNGKRKLPSQWSTDMILRIVFSTVKRLKLWDLVSRGIRLRDH